MSYKIKNTALDHTKRFLHRTAPKLQMEPVLAGRRLRIRSSMVISDELFEHNKANLELYKGWGVVDWEKVGEEKSVDEKKPHYVPTKEEVLAAGYSSEAADSIIKREQRIADGLPADETPPEQPVQDEPPAPPADASLVPPQEPPPAETTPAQDTTKPQPKSPFKGKKQ